MKNLDPWEPTIPAGYTLSPEAAYGGGVSTHLTPGPTYLTRWPILETSVATTVAAAAATLTPTLKAYSARQSSGRGVRGNPGRGSGGIGGGGEGEEERRNAMAYNNAYVEGRHAGAMPLITQKAILAGVKISALLVKPNCKACPAFHIKGMCNTGCENAADHVPHTQEEDLLL